MGPPPAVRGTQAAHRDALVRESSSNGAACTERIGHNAVRSWVEGRVEHLAGDEPRYGSPLGAQHTRTPGTLPFTGVDLLYAVIAGLVLVGAGLRLRRRVTA